MLTCRREKAGDDKPVIFDWKGRLVSQLRAALEGNTITVMLATISPAGSSEWESIDTILSAERAMTIPHNVSRCHETAYLFLVPLILIFADIFSTS
jgi:hypothetical protein